MFSSYNNPNSLYVTFYGVRGSYPMPGPDTLVYGGNTSCHAIFAGGRLLIFDAGSGIISLGIFLRKFKFPISTALFFSHTHHDHTSGLLYFSPVYRKSTTVSFFGPSKNHGGVRNTLQMLTDPIVHPVPLESMGMSYSCTDVDSTSIVCWSSNSSQPKLVSSSYKPLLSDIIVRCYDNPNHTIPGVMNYRVDYMGKSYVYATDVESGEKGDDRLALFAKDANLLAHDAQFTREEYYLPSYPKIGWGHSTPDMAINTAKLANVKSLAFIHHDPEHTDSLLSNLEQNIQKIFPNSFFAKENQTIEL